MCVMLSPETLRRFPFFAGLDAAVLTTLAIEGQEISVRKGNWLFYAGDTADALYIVISGSIELRVALDRLGAHHAGVCTLGEGEMLGWSSLSDPYTYRLGAFALADSRLARWSGPDFCALMGSNPAVGYMLMNRIAQIASSRMLDICVRFASLVEGDRWQGFN